MIDWIAESERLLRLTAGSRLRITQVTGTRYVTLKEYIRDPDNRPIVLVVTDDEQFPTGDGEVMIPWATVLAYEVVG